ncbi:hypothetical protein SPRG_05431 [Saprolegnia parasitica CBS 223.65]|uniref:Uncharacterized protein n=1 Tax=Saprolegnia parasitica (strain CBS 223.65) TaxID=695850 RepID=A0A067CEP7_SAPPC|nr:hypothetical protein SPRG_05431 [Saprolegnia parasitica CBS 223.65]KDO29189.1 hypothetical protein SPRG_05431 [Saprolegnia parasitica CBS 223.65]|eukprot:XP_012200066.1 hypothetical protein SPRG_05431 [Saprolegnia parasitica CBS 223.65]
MATETSDAFEGAGNNSMSGVFTPTPDCVAAEHLSGAPLQPNNVYWSMDGKLAVVVHDGIMISTFVNKDLCRYLLQPPFVSRTNIALSKRPANTRYPLPPPAFSEATPTAVEAPGTIMYRIMNSFEAVTSANPRELSMAKPDVDVFLQASWGPRGSAPNAACALLALTTANRILLHFPSSLNLNWECCAVLSDIVAAHMAKVMPRYGPLPDDPSILVPLPRAPKRRKAELSYAEQCDFMATTCFAWSSTSLLAICGRRLTTIWHFDLLRSGYLEKTPRVEVDTGVHGWPTSASWSSDGETLYVATASSHILSIVVADGSLRRVWTVPRPAPIVSIAVGANHVFAAFGGTLSAWSIAGENDQVPVVWPAHDGTISVLAVQARDNTLFSCAIDGAVKAWHPDGSPAVAPNLPTKGYPVYGLSISPNDAQISCTYIVPPAARPCRTTQADTTYSRVSGGLEHFATPLAKDAPTLAETLRTALAATPARLDSLFDVLALCYHDLVACTAKEAELRSLHADTTGVRPMYRPVADALASQYTRLDHSDAWAAPTLLQAAYQIWSTVPASQKECPAWVVPVILAHAAERHVLTASTAASLDPDTHVAALLMADYLWHLSTRNPDAAPVSFALKPNTRTALRQLYTAYGTVADIARLDTGAGELPVREACELCAGPVPLTASILEPVCAKGHAAERSFLSFRLVSTASVWKCTLCGSFANVETAPTFYSAHSGADPLHCTVCGSYCHLLAY